MMNKEVIKQIELTEHKHSRGFSSVGLRSSSALNTDPFLNLDLFKMSEPTFPPHPHAGFSAVTYLLPESRGAFRNRDSFGDKSLIMPGDIHWTQAGSGMLHEEVPTEVGPDCLGFQIFVNLSDQNKNLPPKAFHVSAHQMPELIDEVSKLRLVAGQYKDLKSPLNELATPVTLLDVSVEIGGSLTLALDSQQNWFMFLMDGNGTISGKRKIEKHQALLLSKTGEQIILSAHTARLRILVCGGQSMGEPVVWGGPFCMTSREEIQLANTRFQNGQMGHLEPSF